MQVGPMLGLLMSLSLVYPLSMLVRGIVEEREKRLKETMCIMGLQGWVLHAGKAPAHAFQHAVALDLDQMRKGMKTRGQQDLRRLISDCMRCYCRSHSSSAGLYTTVQ